MKKRLVKQSLMPSGNLSRSGKGVLLGMLLAAGLSQARVANAHGTDIEVSQSAVAVKATFDDGTPMADAQVLVYSPEDLATPWQKGQTDASGTYLFAPDAKTPGAWEVTVRKAGHGGTTTFVVDAAGVSAGAASTVGAASPTQKWVSMAAVVWGFVGTALFFSRRSSARQPSVNASESVRSAVADPVSVGSPSGGQR
ncbi:MAG: carboxypeptidase regulatory-like domain-containing protein [Cyanobacteria bacterium P01_C01_bin.69]